MLKIKSFLKTKFVLKETRGTKQSYGYCLMEIQLKRKIKPIFEF